MPDFILENSTASAAVAVLALTWFMYYTRRRRIPHGAAVPITVYCLHCNWEGKVTQGARRCGGCGCKQLTVINA